MQAAPPIPVQAPEPVSPPVLPAAPAPTTVAPARPAAPAPTTQPAPSAEPAQRPSQAPATQPPAASDYAPRLRFGAPDDDIFRPREGGAPAGDAESPSIDLERAKKRAAESIARDSQSPRTLMPVIPPPPVKEARPLEKAIKPDCRDAYAGMGVLAAVPLVAAAITDKGCRW
jgi:hypothetical protein